MAHLEKLIELLESTCDDHQKLLEIAKEKRYVLIEGDIPGLQDLMSRESVYVERIKEYEQQREHLVLDYLGQNGIEINSLNLDGIIDVLANQTIKNRINHTAGKLRDIINELTALNETNQQLIETSLSYLQYSIGLFAQKEQAIGYGPYAVNRYSNLFDAKA